MWQETGFVFTNETGEPLRPRNALRALKVAAARPVAVRGAAHPAALGRQRHALLRRPLKVVSEVLGQSSIAITGDVRARRARR